MKLHLYLLLAFLGTATARAAIVIPGANGSDGALNITTNTVIDLSQAITGEWDADNTAFAGLGVYDSNKWAVVFKYTDVTIAAGATVTFKNHPSRAPVVWLVSGNVAIESGAVVSLDGQTGQPSPALSEPGPGGFRGGMRSYSSGVGQSTGFGVGGGYLTGAFGTGASHATDGKDKGGNFVGIKPYGNPSLVPLLGGSGGAGANAELGAGGGGGGAILIAVAGSLTNNGTIRANGGQASHPQAGGGSGGGIRLVADALVGSGVVSTLGGAFQYDTSGAGGLGRIRIERVVNTNSITVIPDSTPVDLTAGTTALIWPPTGAPEVRIVSIGGSNAPADPRAAFGTLGADVVLPQTDSVQVVVETTNVETASQVIIRGTPRSNGSYVEVNAAVASEAGNVVRWTSSLPVNGGYSAVQVKVIRP